MTEDVIALRHRLSTEPLFERDAAAHPMEQLRVWWDEAEAAAVPEPEAVTLATASPSGRPSARMVLLKGFDAEGLLLYTNYRSRKSSELADNPWAALVVWWPELRRQVRVEGNVARLPAEESDAYFATRPRGSQLGAWASPQSEVLASREELERRFAEVSERFAGQEEIPRPAHWGGYRLVPVAVEFWQSRENRLHDRLRYRREQDAPWRLERLAP